LALQHEVEDYDEADYYVDDDGRVEEVSVEFLFGPLEEGDGEGGFHHGGEDYVDYFEEEDVLECVLVSNISPVCRKMDILHTFKLCPMPDNVAEDVCPPMPFFTPSIIKPNKLA
jgi:hypothetical protein